MSDLGNKNIMAKNIQHYMSLHNKSRQEMCDALGVKYTTFTDWVKGNVYPRIDKIELMANYFNISKADLIEGNGPQNAAKREREQDLLSRFNILNDRGKHKVIEYTEELTHNILFCDTVLLNAAHERTDIDVTDEMRKHDDDIMDEEDF